MADLLSTFRDGPAAKGSFLSRVFGILNEEIIRIWAMDPRSPYDIADRRPTLYDAGRAYTLDFLFLRDGNSFVSEMKCEVQYQNYRFWKLTEPSQLDHHKNKKAFELFLRLASDSSSVPVRAGTDIRVDGTVLIWGSASSEGIDLVKGQFGFHDVLTVEKCISDLASWENERYLKLLNERQEWSSSLFNTLREIDR